MNPNDLDGWTHDAVLDEWTYTFMTYTSPGGGKATLAVVSGAMPGDYRLEDSRVAGKAYDVGTLTPGRYEHALGRFKSVTDDDARRLWFIALDTIATVCDIPVELRMETAAAVWQSGYSGAADSLDDYYYLMEDGATTFPLDGLDRLVVQAATTADDNDMYDGFMVAALKQLYPGSAESIELFQGEIAMALRQFRDDESGAKAYIAELVKPRSAEAFELPNLDA